MSQFEVEYTRIDGVRSKASVNYRAQQDHYGNAVSLLRVAHGGGRHTTYRMVHHTADQRAHVQRATIYRGRGTSVSYRSFDNERDTCERNCRVGDFSTSWGDGDNLGVDTPADMVCYSEQLSRAIGEWEFTFAVLEIVNLHDLWTRKEKQNEGGQI